MVRKILVKSNIEKSMLLAGKYREMAEMAKVNSLRINPLHSGSFYRPRTI
jgi:hypothetical protein